ncbi:hypothetical protein ACQ4PT_055033 [Festuca glaucescens]
MEFVPLPYEEECRGEWQIDPVGDGADGNLRRPGSSGGGHRWWMTMLGDEVAVGGRGAARLPHSLPRPLAPHVQERFRRHPNRTQALLLLPPPPHVLPAGHASQRPKQPPRALLSAVHLQGPGEMRATSSAATAWAVVLLAALVSVSLASASVHAGFSPTHAPTLAAPMPSSSAAPPHPAAPRAVLPRKVLRPAGTDVVVGGAVRPHRVDDGCAGADDIAIYQGRATTLPSGVPAYTVDVMNRCSAGDGGDCAIAGIHVRCGWFSSVTLVDPRKFRRLARDDCLINDGQPLLAGETLSFEYANSFPYPLSVALATCVDPAAATSP